jgi:hypothetical protein
LPSGLSFDELPRHGLRKLAWFGQVIDARVLAHTVVNNRQRDTMPFVVDPRRLMAPPVARSALDRH